MEIKLIEKEAVLGLKFPAKDVLEDTESRQERRRKLEQARTLGNGYKTKVKILFQTVEGPRKVETTVWDASEDQILLKAGVWIPVHAILDVEQ